MAEDAASHGAWWIEPAFDAERYSTHRQGSPYQLFQTQEEGWHFALQAAEAAERTTGVGIGFMSAVDRILPLERAMSRARVTADLVKSNAHMIRSGMTSLTGSHAGIVAFGLHGNEEGYPPEPFAEAFRTALHGTGLLSTPHAGEIAPFPGGGPTSVRDAIDHLGAHRILHGVLAIEEPRLVERLAREQICLDVCPSSNLLLNVFPSAEAHALPKLLDAGVPCDLAGRPSVWPELTRRNSFVPRADGLSDAQLATMARTSFPQRSPSGRYGPADVCPPIRIGEG